MVERAGEVVERAGEVVERAGEVVLSVGGWRTMTVRRVGRSPGGSEGVCGRVAVTWRRVNIAATTRATPVAMSKKIIAVPPVLIQALSIRVHLSGAATSTSDIGCWLLELKSLIVIWVVDPGSDSLIGLD